MDFQEYWGLSLPWTITLGLLFALYAYHRHCSAWRVVPAGIPWYSGKVLWWPSQVLEHIQDCMKGIRSVTEGYNKVLNSQSLSIKSR